MSSRDAACSVRFVYRSRTLHAASLPSSAHHSTLNIKRYYSPTLIKINSRLRSSSYAVNFLHSAFNVITTLSSPSRGIEGLSKHPSPHTTRTPVLIVRGLEYSYYEDSSGHVEQRPSTYRGGRGTNQNIQDIGEHRQIKRWYHLRIRKFFVTFASIKGQMSYISNGIKPSINTNIFAYEA